MIEYRSVYDGTSTAHFNTFLVGMIVPSSPRRASFTTELGFLLNQPNVQSTCILTCRGLTMVLALVLSAIKGTWGSEYECNIYLKF